MAVNDTIKNGFGIIPILLQAFNAGAAYLFQAAQEPPQSVPEGDNVVGLLLLAGGFSLKRVISRLLNQ